MMYITDAVTACFGKIGKLQIYTVYKSGNVPILLRYRTINPKRAERLAPHPYL